MSIYLISGQTIVVTFNMTTPSRNCWTHHAWRYIAIVLFVVALIAATVPLGFGAGRVVVGAIFLSVIFSGWYFLGLFWNIFVVCWESCRGEVMHPAAVVALDLCTWMYSVVALAFSVIEVVGLADAYANSRRNGVAGYRYWYYQISYGQYVGGVSCHCCCYYLCLHQRRSLLSYLMIGPLFCLDA